VVLEVDCLSKRFEGICALDEVSVVLGKAETVAIIGPNGAGKSTLFNILTGVTAADRGAVTFNGTNILGWPPHRVADIGISRTFQDVRLIPAMSALENLLFCFRGQLGESLRTLFLRQRLWRKQEAENKEKSFSLLHLGGIQESGKVPAGALSYGQQKILAILCCLAANTQLLLLDEPVAGIADSVIEKISAILRELRSLGKSVLLIEHNMSFVKESCDRVIFLDAGRKISEGTLDEVRHDKRVLDAYFG